MAKEKAPQRIWDNNKIIGEVAMSPKTKMVICASIRDGVKYVNFRQWYQRRDGVWRPSLDGFCMGVEVSMENAGPLKPIPAFLTLVADAVAELKIMPLYDEANAVYKQPKV